MNKKNILKIIFLFTFAIFLCFSFVTYAESSLPVSEGIELPDPDSTISETGKWAFYFLIGLAGTTAFGVLIWAGFLYITSAGNPTQISDAKSKGGAAIFGVIFMFASYLILTTINPELTNFTSKEFDIQNGIVLNNTTTTKSWNYVQSTAILSSKIKVDKEGEVMESSAYTIDFISPPDKLLGIYVYKNESYYNTMFSPAFIENNGGSVTLPSEPGSIYLLWNKAGIYLYNDDNPDSPPKILTSSSTGIYSIANMTDRIVINKKDGKNFNVVLFENENYYGKYALLDSTPEDGLDLNETSVGSNNLESIFIYTPSSGTRTVSFYPQANLTFGECNPSTLKGIISEDCKTEENEDFNLHSFQINPGTALLLSFSENEPESNTNWLKPEVLGELFIAKDNSYMLDDIKTTQIYTTVDICNKNAGLLNLIPIYAVFNGFSCAIGEVIPEIFIPDSYIIIPFEL